jgi:hypothetical protein
MGKNAAQSGWSSWQISSRTNIERATINKKKEVARKEFPARMRVILCGLVNFLHGKQIKAF